jgi:NAD(P)-dependent dehydrogenase (short-subunit alcohol dehydrogenase family)
MFRPDALAGRVALITGGGTGLGRAVAEHFVRHGARCVIAGRREEVLRETARELGDAVLPVACDVRDLLQVEDAVARAVERFGRVDTLVNNAAANFLSPTEELTPNAFRLVGDVVYQGAVHCTLTLGKRWIADGAGGTVLNVLTTYAATGSAYVVPSACAKSAVATLTRSLAAEWGRYGIRLVGLAPGPFPTPGAENRLFIDPSWKERAIRRIPARRLGRLEEFGQLAVFLASAAGSYINGQVITIDGGEAVALSGEFNFLEEVTPEVWRAYRRSARRSGAAPRAAAGPDPCPSRGSGAHGRATSPTALEEE